MSDYDELDEVELSQEDAREAAKTLYDQALLSEDEYLRRVASVLDAFAAGSIKIIPEE